MGGCDDVTKCDDLFLLIQHRGSDSVARRPRCVFKNKFMLLTRSTTGTG